MIIPRNGCKSYKVPDTNVIYVMGGFYSDESNYLKFQTDLTQIRFEPSTNPANDPKILITNVPKKFFYQYDERCHNP